MKKREPVVKTKRMVLRPMPDDDIDRLSQTAEDDDLRAAYQEMLTGCQEHPENRIWYAPWSMTRKIDGAYLGDLCFKGPVKDHAVEIGYGVLPQYEKQGYTTEAVAAMAQWVFQNQDIVFLEAETEPDNKASQRVLEKCGFKPDGAGEEGPRFVLERVNMRNETAAEECLICKAPLVYLEKDEMMECAVCRKKVPSKTRCVNGHYVCDECHTKGMDVVIGLCLRETSQNPIAILERLMAQPFCHMHGPEHHVLVGSALLTAYKNAGGSIDLGPALLEMQRRGKSVPGGACGFWGACGAGISSGMFVSIISSATPLTGEPFGLSNRMTAKALEEIGTVGGPRCCKRDSYLSILAAIDFVKAHFGVEMEKPEVVCTHAAQNNQCIGKRCPFSRANHGHGRRYSG